MRGEEHNVIGRCRTLAVWVRVGPCSESSATFHSGIQGRELRALHVQALEIAGLFE